MFRRTTFREASMRKIAVAVAATVALGLVAPGTVQAHQGEELIQETNGSVLLLTRFTDGEGGFPGAGRRLYQHAHETNGLISYTFPIDETTWEGRFELTVTGQQNPPGDADLGIYLYKDLGDGGNAAATTTAEYDLRAPGGEEGFIPPDSYYGIVFMSRGLNVSFSYKGYTPMGVEVSETGYAPSEVTVKQGATVVWENVGQEFHSVSGATFDSSPTLKHPLDPGETFSNQFTEAGDFPYHDKFGTATGVVHVVPGPGAGTPAE
jgi:plastocyanin